MSFTITLQEVLVLVLAVVGIVVAVYLLLFIKNTNRLITNANETLAANQERLGEIITHIEEVSGDSAYLSGELRKQFEENEFIVRSVMQTGADSMGLINDTTSRIRTLISNVNDIVGMVNKIIK